MTMRYTDEIQAGTVRAKMAAVMAESKARIDVDVSHLVPNAKRHGLKPNEFVALVRRVHSVAITTAYARDLLGAKAS